MANPYLPSWEYIPDGEPRVFGDRIYIYGSHDRVDSSEFCDFRLKVWSAPVTDPGNWTCHGDIFHTREDRDHGKDTPWADRELYAPDVVEKDGRYYLYAYIVGCPGCVAVSDRPEGPFRLLGTYDAKAQYEDIVSHPGKYLENPEAADSYLVDGRPEEEGTEAEIAARDMRDAIMIDPGVLVDDDGRVYVYCGFLHSYMFEVDPSDMRTVIPGSYRKDIIPKDGEFEFFEACSPRKINGTYYLIYSPRRGSRLAYATSDKPTGPFRYRGYLVDNGIDYPGGNDHGSVCRIGDQWYIFYHRMTNNTIMSRRGAVEKIELLPDGSFTTAEMTSCGFGDSLNPYYETPADLACVLKGGCYITEESIFERPIVNIKDGAVIGFKNFDFGTDRSGTSLFLMIDTKGMGQSGKIHVLLDSEDGTEIGCGEFFRDDRVLRLPVGPVTGLHALYLKVDCSRTGWMKDNFTDRELIRIRRIVFCK